MQHLIHTTTDYYRHIQPAICERLLNTLTANDFSLTQPVPENLRQALEESRERHKQLIEAMDAIRKKMNSKICHR